MEHQINCPCGNSTFTVHTSTVSGLPTREVVKLEDVDVERDTYYDLTLACTSCGHRHTTLLGAD